MFLTITQAAQSRLQPKLGSDTHLILDFNDGVGPYSDAATCTLDVAFNLVLTSEPVPADFDTQLSSDLGTVYVKGYAVNQLDSALTLDVDKYLRYKLSGPSGTLDPNVTLITVDTTAHPTVIVGC